VEAGGRNEPKYSEAGEGPHGTKPHPGGAGRQLTTGSEAKEWANQRGLGVGSGPKGGYGSLG